MKIKKLFKSMIVLTLTLSLSVTSSVSAAAISGNENKKINSIDLLESAIEDIQKDETITTEEKKYIESNLELATAEAYILQHEDEIKNIVNETDGELISTNVNNITQTITQTYEYKINDIISVERTTENSFSIPPTSKSLIEFSGAWQAKHKSYTTKASQTTKLLGFKVCTLCIAIDYTIKSSSITATYLSTSGSMSAGSLTVNSKKFVSKTASGLSGTNKIVGIASFTWSALGYGTAIVDLKTEIIIGGMTETEIYVLTRTYEL